MITKKMKAACIGEFKVDQLMNCEHCAYDFTNNEDDTCVYCDGAGDYILNVRIPWSTIKDIYKAMKAHEPSPWKPLSKLESYYKKRIFIRQKSFLGIMDYNPKTPDHLYLDGISLNSGIIDLRNKSRLDEQGWEFMEPPK